MSFATRAGNCLANRREENGQTTTEYGLIISIVAIAVVAGILLTAGSLVTFYDKVVDTINTYV